MSIQIGISPISWQNDDLPELTAAYTMEQALQDYSGWIVVEAEQDPAKAPPYEYGKIGYDHIVSICQKSGLMINARP